MIATMLFSGVLLADPGGTISYEKKVMVDPDYRPSRTAAEIRETLADRRVAPRTFRPLSPPRAIVPRVVPRVAPRVAPRVVYTAAARPRVTWSVGASYASAYRYDGWGTRVGVSYGIPVTRYSRTSWSGWRPASWSIGVGYRTSWGFLGLRYGRGYRTYDSAPRYTHAYSSCGPRWSSGRRQYRASYRTHRSYSSHRLHRSHHSHRSHRAYRSHSGRRHHR